MVVSRRVVHAIANRGAVEVRWLTMISPAWASGWIEEESADPGNREAISARYGLEIVSPPL